MKRINHFFKLCELPKGSRSSADAAEPVAVMEEADSSGSAVVVAGINETLRLWWPPIRVMNVMMREVMKEKRMHCIVCSLNAW